MGRAGLGVIPSSLAGLCDDAALFPPGNAPLETAVPQHLAYRNTAFADLVGPFVFPIPRLGELTAPTHRIEVSLTAPGGPDTVTAALDTASGIDNVTVAAVEVTLPGDSADLSALDALHGIEVFVEVPRDERRRAVFEDVAERGLRAKFRTGGVTADLYPDEVELATAIHTAAALGIAFKATAGLHHAIRNTNSTNGFEQHGYLNVLLAANAASDGADPDDLAYLLASRDSGDIARQVAATIRPRTFLSFGTCSITEPLDDLIALGLITPARTKESSA